MAKASKKNNDARALRAQAPRAPEPKRAVGSGESAATVVVTNRHGIEVSTAK
tara:strand:+ start:198 stop:353 length:156 start_codon:yes stop_codon:yes gene_type:complete